MSIDKTCNQHGKSFLEFLNDSRCCILNGRFGEESEEYTFYSTRGHSVVDYICLPLDNFTLCQNFQITKCTDLVERYNLYHRLGERSKIPDHNVLTIDLKVYSQLQTDNQRDSQNKKRFKFRRIPADFLSSHTAITAINSIIARIERCRETQTQIDALYKEFRETMLREMSKKIPTYDWSARTRKRLRPHKPYWNEERTELWRHMCEMEKKVLKCDPKERRLKQIQKQLYKESQNSLDKRIRFYERKHKLELALNIDSVRDNDPKQFWDQIKKLAWPSTQK